MNVQFDPYQTASGSTESVPTVSLAEKNKYEQYGLIRTHNLPFHVRMLTQHRKPRTTGKNLDYSWERNELPREAKEALQAAVTEHPQEAQDILVCHGLKKALHYFLRPQTGNEQISMYGISAKDLSDKQADFLTRWLPLELNGMLVDESQFVQEAVANKFVVVAKFTPVILRSLMR